MNLILMLYLNSTPVGAFECQQECEYKNRQCQNDCNQQTGAAWQSCTNTCKKTNDRCRQDCNR